jgi:hypothetical protein
MTSSDRVLKSKHLQTDYGMLGASRFPAVYDETTSQNDDSERSYNLIRQQSESQGTYSFWFAVARKIRSIAMPTLTRLPGACLLLQDSLLGLVTAHL